MFNDWTYLYKRGYERTDKLSPTNMLHTPYISPDKKSLLMHYDENSEYQKYNKKLSKELVSYFYIRELDGLKQFQSYNWCPKLLDYDVSKQTILIEFNQETLNNILTDESRNLNIEFPNWVESVENIITDLYNAGYYKMSLYPHCFFLGQDGNLKTIDFYAVLKRKESVDRNFISGIIGDNSIERFDFATVNNKIDFDKFFEYTMKYQLQKNWLKENPFPNIYEKLNANS